MIFVCVSNDENESSFKFNNCSCSWIHKRKPNAKQTKQTEFEKWNEINNNKKKNSHT